MSNSITLESLSKGRKLRSTKSNLNYSWLNDLLTKPQPHDLFEAQREGIMLRQDEHKKSKDKQFPGKHLRACEIIESLASPPSPKQSEGGVACPTSTPKSQDGT